MKAILHFSLAFVLFCTPFAKATNFSKFKKPRPSLQLGLGMGVTLADPLSPSVNSLVAAIEGSYRYQNWGLSILASLTSSTSIEGTYWFGPNYSAQHTYIEPRYHIKFFHIGPSFGVSFYGGDFSDQIQALFSYGGMAGVEFPMGALSLGADVRYILTSYTPNTDPFSAMFMLRWKF